MSVVFYLATYGTLLYLTVRELRLWWLRRQHRDRIVVLTELPPQHCKSSAPIDAPHWTPDPSPTPRPTRKESA